MPLVRPGALLRSRTGDAGDEAVNDGGCGGVARNSCILSVRNSEHLLLPIAISG